MVGSKIIDRAMRMIMEGELAKATVTWKQAHFGVMSGSLQLPHRGKGGWVAERGVTCSAAPDPTALKEFCLDNIQGHICTTERVTISLFGTINIYGKTDI